MNTADTFAQSNDYYKIGYFVCLSITALALIFFDLFLIRGKAGCSQRECLDLAGTFKGILSLSAIIGLPFLTLILLQIGSKFKYFAAKIGIALIPSSCLIFTTSLITSIGNIGFQPYLVFALYPFILMLMSLAADHVKSASTRVLLNAFPIALMLGFVIIGFFAFLILSQSS
jgi:hypothetical protein